MLYGSSGALSIDGRRGSALPGFSLPDFSQNLLLYIPFGVFGVWTVRRYASAVRMFAGILALSLLYSVAMELLQTVSAARIASPLDVIANVTGAGLGVWMAPHVERALVPVVEQLRSTGLSEAPSRYVLAALLAAIVVVAWYPFDITLDVSTLSERTRPVRRDPWLWPGAFEVWLQAVLYGVLSLVMAISLPRLARRAAPIAAIASVTGAVLIDFGQLWMGHYPIGVASFLSQASGACVGAAAAVAVALARDNWYASA